MAYPVFPIPLPYLVAIPGVMIMIIVVLLWFLLDIKRYAREAFVIRKARKGDKPALLLEEIGTGLTSLIIGERDEKGSPIFKLPDSEDHIVDPAYLHNTKPANWGSGLMVHHYATSQYQPMTTANALGLQTCLRVAREKYPEFSWMKDRDVMAFAKMNREHLDKNSKVILSYYKPQWDDGSPVTSKDLTDLIVHYQDSLKQLRMDVDIPMAWDAAFAMNPVTHTNQDLSHMRSIIQRLEALKWQKKMNLLTYALAFAMVVIAGGCFIFLVTTAK